MVENIKQKIKAYERSICPKCVHWDVCRAAENQPCVECSCYLPAADVVEVRHGRWIAQPPDFDLCGVAYYQCSECGKEQQTPSNYCQFCGARCDL